MYPGDQITAVGGAVVAQILRVPRGKWLIGKLPHAWATEFHIRKTTLRDKYGVQWKVKE
jgi:hypothetical protein